MNKEDLYRKFECEIQKLYTPNRNIRTYNNLTTEQYKNLEFAKRQLLLHDQWCCSTVRRSVHYFDSNYFHHTFPLSVPQLYPNFSLFYHDMIKWYEYYFVESENDSLIERLHKNNRRSIMNTIIKRMEEPAK